jgi:hypothetical protein
MNTDLITAIGSIATPLLLIIFGGIGWVIKSSWEDIKKREEQLRSDRIDVYDELIEPFAILLTKDEAFPFLEGYEGKNKEQVIKEKILSVSYRQTSFKLMLMGSDEVIRAYNRLMQFFYTHKSKQNPDTIPFNENHTEWLSLFGNLLLEIRRSVGNKDTALSNYEMLEWLISDIQKYKK